jgi:hypothetical protein
MNLYGKGEKLAIGYGYGSEALPLSTFCIEIGCRSSSSRRIQMAAGLAWLAIILLVSAVLQENGN